MTINYKLGFSKITKGEKRPWHPAVSGITAGEFSSAANHRDLHNVCCVGSRGRKGKAFAENTSPVYLKNAEDVVIS